MRKIDMLTLGVIESMESKIAQMRVYDMTSDSYVFAPIANENLVYLERSIRLLANPNLRFVWAKRIASVRLAIANQNPNYK